MSYDYIYSAGLNADPLYQELQRINDSMKALGQQGQQSFQQVESSSEKAGEAADSLGVKFGVVAGIAQSMTNKIIELGQRFAQMAYQYGQESIQIAEQYQVSYGKLLRQLGGDEEKVNVVLNRVQKKASEVGMEVSEALSMTTAFLPDVDNVDRLEQVFEVVSGLAQEDPVQGMFGARLALDEALSGSTMSLKQRFEFTKKELDIIKDKIAETGNQTIGTIEGMTEVLKRRGVDVTAFGETLTGTQAQAEYSFGQIKLAFGQPLADQVQQTLSQLNEVFAGHSDELRIVATQLGLVISEIIETSGNIITKFAQYLSSDNFSEIAGLIGDIAIDAATILESIANVEWQGEFIENALSVESVLSNLSEALQTAMQIEAMAKAEDARLAAKEKVAKSLGYMGSDYVMGSYTSAAVLWGDEEDLAAIEAAGVDAYNKTMLQSIELMKKGEERKNALAKSTQEATEAIKAENDATGDQNPELPGAGEAGAEDEKTQKARKKLDDAAEKARITHERNMLDIQTDFQQKFLDMQQDFGEKRLDMETKYQQQIEDINRKFARDIAEIQDFSDEEQALAQKHREALVELDRDTSRERQEIERDYQRQIQAIQRQFEADAEDAARNQDAIAFLRAQENRDRSLTDAAINRDEKLQDASTAAQQQRTDLLASQEQEVADAKAANAQKLADLRERLAQELEDAQIKYQRDLEAQALAEQRKTDDLSVQIDRRVQKELEANQRRLDDLQRTLAKEIELVAAAEAQKAQLRAQSTQYSQQASVVQQRMNLPGLEGISGRAMGGGVMAGLPVVVGERGPELFVPPVTGQIVPNHRLMYSPAAQGGGAVTYNQQQLSMSMLDPSQVSPAQRAAMRQEALAILAEL